MGLLWLALTILGWTRGRVTSGVLFWDAIMVLALLVCLRWETVGLAAITLLAVLGVFFDPGGLGMSHYVAAAAVATAAVRGKTRLALTATLVLAALLTVVIYRRTATEHDVIAALLSSAILYSITWLIIIGMRAFIKAETASVKLAQQA